ncbi:hypothetical protein Tco_1350255, partial [Tanacetum coccineum]
MCGAVRILRFGFTDKTATAPHFAVLFFPKTDPSVFVVVRFLWCGFLRILRFCGLRCGFCSPLSTGKENVDVSRGKGIDLLSEVALAKKAQLKEVRKKSLRDFNKTRPSGSGTVAEKPPSVEKITPIVTSEGTDDNNNEQELSIEGIEQENESEEQESDSEQDEESDDDNQEEEEVDQENESEDDEIESDEDNGMDDTTNQFDDDVDVRLEEPTQTGKEVVHGKGANVEM